MTITEIKRDKKHLMRVETDIGKTLFIDRDVVLEFALNAGDEVTEERLKEILYRSEFVRAKERALWYLDRSDYTEKKLYEKLLAASFAKTACAEVIAWLKEYGMLDDVRYAERFAERCASSNMSKRATYCKLLEKGVPSELAKDTLENQETDELSQLRALIEKKYSTKLKTKESVQKVFAALVRRGFSYSSVREALKAYTQELQYISEE